MKLFDIARVCESVAPAFTEYLSEREYRQRREHHAAGLLSDLRLQETDSTQSEIARFREAGFDFAAMLTDVTGAPWLAERWDVGYDPDLNRTHFWYRNRNGAYANCKAIRFSTNGFNRCKDASPYFLGKGADGYGQMFYNEYSLTERPTSPVALVESEKSAILCDWFFPSFVWLGTGGANGITTAKIERVADLLQHRPVLLITDNDEAGTKGTEQAQRRFRQYSIPVTIVSPTELLQTQVPNGFDLADYLYQKHNERDTKSY